MSARKTKELRKQAAEVVLRLGGKNKDVRPIVEKIARTLLTNEKISLHRAVMKAAGVRLPEAIRVASFVLGRLEKKANGPYCNPSMAGQSSSTKPKVTVPKTISGSPSNSSKLFAKSSY